MVTLPTWEVAMDNRLNELRRKISTLRAEMLALEAVVRDQIKQDQDCAESALQLMAMRRALTELVREWVRLGGGDRLPAITERLREKTRPAASARLAAKKVEKRRLLAPPPAIGIKKRNIRLPAPLSPTVTGVLDGRQQKSQRKAARREARR
jgi:hypothetical protein